MRSNQKCDECGASNASSAIRCWLCHRSLKDEDGRTWREWLTTAAGITVCTVLLTISAFVFFFCVCTALVLKDLSGPHGF